MIDLVTSLAVALTVGPLVDRQRAQSRILEEHRLRERTDELRDILVESVSHELRTPLAGIMGAASVLTTAPELAGREKLLSLAAGIEQEAGRLDRLIQDVLDLGRIRAGALQPHLDTLDPWDIVNDALATAQERLRGHDVRLEPAESLPLVRVDPALTAQALVNVLENAAKYTPSGGSIHISAQASPGGVAIAVRDEGAGLEDSETGLIFERFHRGERHADIAGGSGLGLTIARVFVEASGGRIVALSAGPDRGTTLLLILPVAETREGDHDDD
jgi:two-component system sensor histidine kinase KdpD